MIEYLTNVHPSCLINENIISNRNKKIEVGGSRRIKVGNRDDRCYKMIDILNTSMLTSF